MYNMEIQIKCVLFSEQEVNSIVHMFLFSALDKCLAEGPGTKIDESIMYCRDWYHIIVVLKVYK